MEHNKKGREIEKKKKTEEEAIARREDAERHLAQLASELRRKRKEHDEAKVSSRNFLVSTPRFSEIRPPTGKCDFLWIVLYKGQGRERGPLCPGDVTSSSPLRRVPTS